MTRKGMDRVGVLVFSSAAIYAALAVVIGVIPGMVLSKSPPVPGVAPLNAVQARGREVYVGEGCSYCHTQFVRPLAQDRVWGRASVAGDYAYSTPQLLGTERTGPDLTNIGTRQPSEVWQSIHLYEPRSLVNGSIMPAYPWLFVLKDKAEPGDVVVNVPAAYAPAGKVVVATLDEQNLVAYLASLKQAPAPIAGAVNEMNAGPPAGGDPLGTIVVMIGAIATLYAFVVALRTTLRPGEDGESHPKRLIFKDGR